MKKQEVMKAVVLVVAGRKMRKKDIAQKMKKKSPKRKKISRYATLKVARDLTVV